MSASSITRLASKILSRNETSLTLLELQQGAAVVQARLAGGGTDANKRVHCPDGRCAMSGLIASSSSTAAAASSSSSSSSSPFSLASLLPRGGKCTPLAVAVLSGDLALLDVLLSHGADPNKLSGLPHRFDFAPLHLAAALGSAAAVSRLLAAGADANARLDKCRGLAPKQEAPLPGASLKHTAVGDTALHLAVDCTASCSACCDVVRALLAHPGTNPNTRNHAGLTPLTVACRRKREDVVDLLLAVVPPPAAAAGAGAAPHAPGSLHAGGHPRLDVNASGPLFAAISVEDAGLVRKLLAAGASARHVRNEEGLSPLAYTVYRGSPTFASRAEVVSLLLAAGATVEPGLLQHATDSPAVREALISASASAGGRTVANGPGGGGSTSTSGAASLRASGNDSGSGFVSSAASGSGVFARRSQGSAGGAGAGGGRGASADGSTGSGSSSGPAAAAAGPTSTPPAVVMGVPIPGALEDPAGATATTTSSQPRGRFSFLSALGLGLGLRGSGSGPGGSCCLPPPPFSASSGLLRAMRGNLCGSLLFAPLLLPVLVMALFIDALMPLAAAACGFLRIALPVMALLCVLVLYGVVHVVLQAAAPLLTTLAAAAAAAAGGMGGGGGVGKAGVPLPALAADLAAGAGAGVAVLGAAEAGMEALGHAGSAAGLAAAAAESMAAVGALEQGVEAAASLVVNNLSNYIAAATAPGPAAASVSASLSGLGAAAAAASKALTGALSAALAALLPCGLASAASGPGGLWRWQGPLGLLAGLAAWFLGVVASHALLGLAEEALVGYRPPGDRLRAFLQHRAVARHAGGAAISDEQLAAHARLCLPLALALGGGTGVGLMPLTLLMVVLCLPTVAVGVRKEYERGAWQQQQQQQQPAEAGAAAGAGAAVPKEQSPTQAQVAGLARSGSGRDVRR
ncbi:hypothetical protein HXX76_014483 [Chlamydomonas incerta]|uniref:Uncharacterized protein n=1 Tax=Chlamydomonas incerta TaxID=51695 RepID=A0A835SPY2_CHLIN|nr:hypothetical protein HXX76_014483 [Chlamydomonas incerta]|eukprot:KAG2424430.1 hypothetical protein HXX76_014483 [Chlamydomonas incerta]